MKYTNLFFALCSLCFLGTISSIYAQNATNQLSESDFATLIKIADYYSNNVNLKGKNTISDLETFRTPKLDHIVSTLQVVSKADKSIFDKKYLSRPSNEELQLWYIIREIHYNNINSTKRTNEEVAKEVLNKEIDDRWLLDNYYYRLSGGISFLSNTANLKKININLDEYGLRNKTEKAILYFGIMQPLLTRFSVLSFVKNYDKVNYFAKRLPTINGKPYYYYTDFDYEDFDWIGHEKVESYNTRHLGTIYSATMSYMNALLDSKKEKQLKEIYANSIFVQPNYFKYASFTDDLNQMYKSYKGK
ncbi:hypothetical protein ACE193_25200 [Bernardetia sp. OM2101]|uniref:hypothetical protein n=1 Tax=Bernardetia sp. OM2101 TaxID=3344876 RepID=UPI0035D043D9